MILSYKTSHSILKIARYSVLAFYLLVFQTGCVNTVFLKRNELLFTGQKISGTKKLDKTEMESLFKQKTNRKMLFTMPYLYAYLVGRKFHDTAAIADKIRTTEANYKVKIEQAETSRDSLKYVQKLELKLGKLETKKIDGNWFMRTVGEKPAIYDSARTSLTVKELKNYLFNAGFFDGEVVALVDTNKIDRRVTVTYKVDQKLPHRIRQIRYKTDNDTIRNFLIDNQLDATIKFGQNYNKYRLDQERERILRLLRNNGFYEFGRDYIVFSLDSTVQDRLLGDRILDLDIVIQQPVFGNHEQFKIDEVFFNMDKSETTFFSQKDTLSYNEITYVADKRNYSARILDRKMLARPGEYFNQYKIGNAQSQLSGMDMFKFVNVSIDTFPGHKLRLNYFTSRLPKYQISDELGMLLSQGAPGPFVNVGFKVRNPFNNFEILELNGRYSEEGQISVFLSGVVFRARELSFSSALTYSDAKIPRRILGQRLLNYNPKTKIIGSFTNVVRPEYQRSITRAALIYTFQLSPQELIGITPLEANVIILPPGGLNAQFEEIINSVNPTLRNSFNSAFLTNFNFFYQNSNADFEQKKRSRYFRFSAEYGGEALHWLNELVIKDPNNKIWDLQTFRYLRLQSDFRKYTPYSRSGMLAARLNAGFATPIGNRANATSLPWEKFFFVGGSNSIRAWYPRRLGPGTYFPEGETDDRRITEQQGEILLEASVEFRQKLVSFLEGAFFVDAGNVWLIKPNSLKPGADFRWSTLYESIALGTGAGIRFDFSFLIIRFDVGVKAYDPTAEPGSKWAIRDVSFRRKLGQRRTTPILNFGIGYPF